jgi:hypothetical protein
VNLGSPKVQATRGCKCPREDERDLFSSVSKSIDVSVLRYRKEHPVGLREDIPISTRRYGELLIANAFVDLTKVFDFHFVTEGRGSSGDWTVA